MHLDSFSLYCVGPLKVIGPSLGSVIMLTRNFASCCLSLSRVYHNQISIKEAHQKLTVTSLIIALFIIKPLPPVTEHDNRNKIKLTLQVTKWVT